MGKSKDVIRSHIQQYEVARLLVNVHRQNPFILVKATTNLGKAYLDAKYYQQSFEHLTNAFKLNSTLISKSEEAKQYHSGILTLLGRCYTEGGEADDALQLLGKALKINKTIMGEDDYSNSTIHLIMARAYVKKEEYKKALKHYSSVLEHTEIKYGLKSKEMAEVFLELADTYDKKKEHKEAVEFQKKAHNIYKETEDMDQKTLAATAITLGEMYADCGMLNEAISTLREVICHNV